MVDDNRQSEHDESVRTGLISSVVVPEKQEDGKEAASTEETRNNEVEDATSAIAAMAIGGESANAGGEEESEDEEDDADRIDMVFEKLRELLRDTGRFHDLCEQGFAAQGGKLETATDLQAALNVICHDIGMDDVTSDEAADLFMEDLNSFEFYSLAKPFFESIARTLDEDSGNLIIPGANPVQFDREDN